MLPDPVIRQIQAELLDWKQTGMSVMEISHRSEPFREMQQVLIQNVRELLDLPAHYQVLLITNTARAQFSMIPMNLLKHAQEPVDYLVTGLWSELAAREAMKFADVNIVADGKIHEYCRIPDEKTWKTNSKAQYFFYCPNETVHGVEFPSIPAVESTLVADMTSCLFTQPLDIEKFGVIFAGTQKNFGIPGLTLLIIREDLIGTPLPATPTTFDYSVHREFESLYCTPNTIGVYTTQLVLQWMLREGGIETFAARHQARSQKLYDFIDQSEIYEAPVEPAARSRMNLRFHLKDESLESEFLSQARSHQLLSLKGHRVLGGCRASLYNAMPDAGVDALLAFMKQFQEAHRG